MFHITYMFTSFKLLIYIFQVLNFKRLVVMIPSQCLVAFVWHFMSNPCLFLKTKEENGDFDCFNWHHQNWKENNIEVTLHMNQTPPLTRLNKIFLDLDPWLWQLWWWLTHYEFFPCGFHEVLMTSFLLIHLCLCYLLNCRKGQLKNQPSTNWNDLAKWYLMKLIVTWYSTYVVNIQ